MIYISSTYPHVLPSSHILNSFQFIRDIAVHLVYSGPRLSFNIGPFEHFALGIRAINTALSSPWADHPILGSSGERSGIVVEIYNKS